MAWRAGVGGRLPRAGLAVCGVSAATLTTRHLGPVCRGLVGAAKAATVGVRVPYVRGASEREDVPSDAVGHPRPKTKPRTAFGVFARP